MAQRALLANLRSQLGHYETLRFHDFAPAASRHRWYFQWYHSKAARILTIVINSLFPQCDAGQARSRAAPFDRRQGAGGTIGTFRDMKPRAGNFGESITRTSGALGLYRARKRTYIWDPINVGAPSFHKLTSLLQCGPSVDKLTPRRRRPRGPRPFPLPPVES